MVASTLAARLDHVAIAVGDVDAGLAYWRDAVGGGMVARETNDHFDNAQLRLAGGGKLEVLAPPSGGGGFVAGFLEQFGPTIHHVTLKVPDLGVAVDAVRAGGFDVVDVHNTSPWWREGFLRPSQVGGLIVQIAWASEDDDQWARRMGVAPSRVAPSAPTLHGPTLEHPDLAAARTLWSLLGADVVADDDRLLCRWPDSPLDVMIQRGATARPVALRFTGLMPAPPSSLGLPPLDLG